MDIQSFVANHGTFATTILILIVAYIGYTLYWFYSRRNTPHPKSPPSRKCLDKRTQDKIANEIHRKLKEIDSCDCKDTCKLKYVRSSDSEHNDSPSSSESASTVSNSSTSESIHTESRKPRKIPGKPEGFGNHDFY